MIIMLYIMVGKIDILFMFKGKTITLLYLTPAEIMQYEKELAEKKKQGP